MSGIIPVQSWTLVIPFAVVRILQVLSRIGIHGSVPNPFHWISDPDSALFFCGFQCDKKGGYEFLHTGSKRFLNLGSASKYFDTKKLFPSSRKYEHPGFRIPCPDPDCWFFIQEPVFRDQIVPGPGFATQLFGNRLEQCSESGRSWGSRIQIWIRILPSIIKPWFHLFRIFMTLCQCCGTAETITFCRSGAGTRMNYSSGSRTGFGSKSNIKWNKKIQNIKWKTLNGNLCCFWHWKGKILLVKFFKTAKYCLEPESKFF